MRIHVGTPGFSLIPHVDAQKQPWWVLRIDEEASRLTGRMVDDLRSIGFHEVREGLWARPHQGFSMALFRQVFPQSTVHKEEPNESLTASETASMNAAIPLGQNISGEMVYDRNGTRLIVAQNGSVVIESESNRAERPARFLRATDSLNLMESLSPLVFRMANGENLSNRDVDAFLERVRVPEYSFSRHDAQESLEALLNRYLIHRISSGQLKIKSDVVAIYDRQPAFNVRNSTQMEMQAYSTPNPLAMAAQLVLSPMVAQARDGREEFAYRPLRIYEPTAGHGGLLTAIIAAASQSQNIQVLANEMDEDRRRRFDAVTRNVLGGRNLLLTGQDATSYPIPEMLDAVIANPPFGTMEFCSESVRAQARKEDISKIDQWIAWRSIQNLREGGRAVLLMGADSAVDSRLGEITSGSFHFLRKIAKEYRIDGLVDVDGKLYEKNGAGWPVRLLVLTRMPAGSDLSDQVDRIPNRLPVLKDWDAVYRAAMEMRFGDDQTWMQKLSNIREAEKREEVRKEQEAQKEQEERAEELVAEGLDEDFREMAEAAREVQEDRLSPSSRSAEDSDLQELVENPWQKPYQALSQISDSTAMIPTHLEGPTQKALDRMMNDLEAQGVDSVDSFVANALDWNLETLKSNLSPEQVDAVALALHSQSRGRAFIEADQTGLGKGRVLASMAYAKIQSGAPVLFITEKPHLFTDFYRDLSDIGASSDVRPLIVNPAKSDVYDQDGNVVFRHDSKKYKELLKNRNFGEANVVFMTYSQLSSGKADNRLEWLMEALQEEAVKHPLSKPLVILDEAHNAAGVGSAVNDRITRLIGNSYVDVMYSSATFAKRADNLPVYFRAMPNFVSEDQLNTVLDRGGDAALEYIAQMLTEDGQAIRREHDNSALTFERKEPKEEDLPDIRTKVDRLAEVLELMGYVAGEVDKVANDYNANLKKVLANLDAKERQQLPTRLGASTQNFGSRLFQIARQYYMAIQAPLAADAAIEALKRGQKPVFVVEQTMESAIRWAVADAMGLDENEEGEASISDKDIDGVSLPNDFRIALNRMADRLASYKITDRRGNVEEVVLDDPKFLKAMEAIHAAIDRIPEGIPLSPIDYLEKRLEEEGFTLAEISGRQIRMVGEGESSRVVLKPKANISEEARHFNNGLKDVALITRSGNSGISLHASFRFADRRQRIFFEWQMPLDVNARVQSLGRVNRKGQESAPVICSLSTGLPGQNREISQQNNKLRRLSASTSGDRDNPALDREIPDLINKVGNLAAFVWAKEHIEVIRKLGIPDIVGQITMADDIAELPDSLQGEGLISKITGRGHMLSVDQQEQLWESLKTTYLQILDDLDMQGENPLKSVTFDWEDPRIEESVEYAPKVSDSAFGGAVIAERVAYTVHRKPIRWEEVQNSLDTWTEEDEERMKAAAEKIRNRVLPEMFLIAGSEIEKIQRAIRKENAEKSEEDRVPVPSSEEILHKLLHEDKDSRLIERRDELLQLASYVEQIKPGRLVSLEDPMDKTVLHGVIRRVRIPEKSPHLQGQWDMQVFVAGKDKPLTASLRSLRGTWKMQTVEDRHGPYVEKMFDNAPEGTFTERRVVLRGNMFMALSMIEKGQNGFMVDPTTGNKTPVILMPRHFTLEALMNRDFQVRDPQAVQYALQKRFEKNPDLRYTMVYDIPQQSNSFQKDLQKSVYFRLVNNDHIRLMVPGARRQFGHILMDKKLLKLSSDKEFEGRGTMAANFPIGNLKPMLERLSALKVNFYLKAEDRDSLKEYFERKMSMESGQGSDHRLSGPSLH